VIKSGSEDINSPAYL